MRTLIRLFLVAALAASGHALMAETTNADVSLQIFSAHFSRYSPETSQRFPQRLGYESTAGTTLQLLLALKEGTLLPVQRDDITIDTFVDDTYQNLMTPSDAGRYSPYGQTGQSTVSEDGQSMIFTIGASRAPAADAGRIFVRGSVQARISHGTPIVVSNQMPLTVGQDVTVGPFKTSLRSVTDQGGTSGVTLQLYIEGETWRIQKLRVYDNTGKSLTEDRNVRLQMSDQFANKGVYTSIVIKSAPKEPVRFAFEYLDKVTNVQIPFEAQLDVGFAKAGPIQSGDRKPAKRTGAQVWPPPPREAPEVQLPPRRSPFAPDTKPAVSVAPSPLKLDKASVDLFSVAIGKPPPAESKGSAWKNPPGRGFYAAGFTMARLLLSVPDATILSVPQDGVTITKFEDDKGGKLDTTVYRDPAPGYFSSSARRSSDEQQMLVNVSLASAPTAGATRCTLAGQVEAKVARGDITNTSPKLEFRRGQTYVAGPYTFTVNLLREMVPASPAAGDRSGIEAWMTVVGPGEKLRSLEFLDEAGQQIALMDPASGSDRSTESSRAVRFASVPKGPVAVRARHFTQEETVKIPFELSTGIGL